MKLVTPIRKIENFDSSQYQNFQEALLCHHELSQIGELRDEDVVLISNELRTKDIRPILNWDRLMTEKELEKARSTFKRLSSILTIEAVRVQDLGALHSILEHCPDIPIQLVVDDASHNLRSVLSACRHAGSRLERVSLSIQIPRDKLEVWIPKIPVEVELLALGPILLLHTPRPLLDSERQRQGERWASASSEEDAGHRNFKTVQNSRGTYLFHPKDHCTLDRIDILRDLKISALRLDPLLSSSPQSMLPLCALVAREERPFEDLTNWGRPFLRCFFQSNKTDVLFKKLKNQTLNRNDDQYLGEVIAVEKGRYLAIHLKHSSRTVRKNDFIRFLTPNGKNITVAATDIMSLDRKPIPEAPARRTFLLPYKKGVTAQSMVLLEDQSPT